MSDSHKALPRKEAPPTAPSSEHEGHAPLDRDAARALTDAGYMPLERYVELFGNS